MRNILILPFTTRMRNATALFLLAFIGFFAITCSGGDPDYEDTGHQDAFEAALRWNNCLLELDRYSEGYRPPVSARMFAYVGMAAWESALPALPEANSCRQNFDALHLPSWEAPHYFVLPAAINGAYFTMAQHFFPHTTLLLKQKCAQLSEDIHADLLSKYSREAVLASRQYGQAVADAVFQWSATDGIGHQAFLFNYDRNFQIPEKRGVWKSSQADPMPPLLPHWGKARTFIVHKGDVPKHPPVEFSESSNSLFFAQALEVYTLSQPLKEENRWIAEFWSDDLPGITFSAASRWISITNQALEKAEPGILTALETWLKVGWAINDACVNIWDLKYTYALERPDTYLRRNISPEWEPLHPTPSFPSYPSGHSGFAGAATEVLTQMLGDNLEITDRSHEGRREFLSKPRSYASFSKMAEENAYSRLLMGVHFRMDCEEGLRIGRVIGAKTAKNLIREKHPSAAYKD